MLRRVALFLLVCQYPQAKGRRVDGSTRLSDWCAA